MSQRTEIYSLWKLFFYTLIFAFLLSFFYKFSEGANDYKAHIQWAKEANITNWFTQYLSYPLFHTSVYYLSQLTSFSFKTSSAIISAAFVLSSIVILDYYLRKHLKLINLSEKFIFGLSIGLNIATAFYIPPLNPYFVFFSGQPFHNPTYIVVKPFAIVSFFLFYEIISGINENRYKDAVLFKFIKKQDFYIIIFCLLIFISLLAKPSFVFVFGPAAVIFAIIELIHSKFNINKIKIICKIALFSIPAVILMFFQNSITAKGDDFSIIFAPFKVWKNFGMLSLPLSLVLSFAFPVFVCVILFKSILKNKILFLSIITGLTGIFEFCFLAEDNYRLLHANFAWSLMCSTLILFIGCSIAFVQYFYNTEIIRSNSWKYYCGFVLLFLHISSGAYYSYALFNDISLWNNPILN